MPAKPDTLARDGTAVVLKFMEYAEQGCTTTASGGPVGPMSGIVCTNPIAFIVGKQATNLNYCSPVWHEHTSLVGR